MGVFLNRVLIVAILVICTLPLCAQGQQPDMERHLTGRA
jgi:hypothetical protein